MEVINNFLNEFMGKFVPMFIERDNGSVYMFLDMMWLLKAVLLVVCVIYTIKGMFSIISMILKAF